MPLSSKLAPGFIRLTYSGVLFPHHQIIPIKFSGDPVQGSEPNLETTDGGTIAFIAGVTAWLTAFKTAFNANTTFGLGEIYLVDPDSGERAFVFANNFDIVGTNVADQVAKSGGQFVYKTALGGKLKVFAMEAVYNFDFREVGSVPADSRQTINDYILSGDNIFYGQGNSFPVAFLSFTSKEYDVLREKQGFLDI